MGVGIGRRLEWIDWERDEWMSVRAQLRIDFWSQHGQRGMQRLHRITVDVDVLRRLQPVAS